MQGAGCRPLHCSSSECGCLETHRSSPLPVCSLVLLPSAIPRALHSVCAHSICTLPSAVAFWCLSMSSLPYTLACSYSLCVSRRLNKLELLHHWALWTCYTHGLESLSPGSHSALLLPFRSLLLCHPTGSVSYFPKDRVSCFSVLFCFI